MSETNDAKTGDKSGDKYLAHAPDPWLTSFVIETPMGSLTWRDAQAAPDLGDLNGPVPFDRKLLRQLKKKRVATEHLAGALKRDKAMTDDEYRAVLFLALCEIGVAHDIFRLSRHPNG